MKRILLSAGMFCATLIASAQCDPQTTLNESFSNFSSGTEGSLPQNCWISSHSYPNVNVAGSDTNKFISVYGGSTSPTAPFYVISPEISTMDGNHKLSFTTLRQAPLFPGGAVTIQPGTLLSQDNYDSFVASGDPIPVTSTTEAIQISDLILPASTTQKYIAFKVVITGMHTALSIDNVVWDEVPVPTCEAIATINEDFSNFVSGAEGGLPQNCWISSHSYPNVNVAGSDTNKFISVYGGSTSPTAPFYVISPEISTMDGNHKLSFTTLRQAPLFPGGAVTIQPGTLLSQDNYDSFVAFGDPISVTSTTEAIQFNDLVLPASTTQKYIAFKVVITGMHTALSIDNVVWDEVPVPTCEAVATINEDFTGFADGAFPQNCWTSSHQEPMTSIDAVAVGSEEKAVTIYSFFSANTPIYVVSPEVSTIDGSHKLSFTALRQAPVMPNSAISIQVGTLSDAADYSTFVPFGTAIAVTSTTEALQIENLVLPASTTQRYIAFQVTATAQHTAIALDNVVWQPVVAGVDGVKANTFSIYPNPTTDKNVTLAYNNISNGHVSVYTITGAKVYETAVSGTTQNINLSALASGMYVVKLESGNFSATQKLIIK